MAKTDVEANVDVYAPDGAILWPDSPIGKGTTAKSARVDRGARGVQPQLVLVPDGQGGVRQ